MFSFCELRLYLPSKLTWNNNITKGGRGCTLTIVKITLGFMFLTWCNSKWHMKYKPTFWHFCWRSLCKARQVFFTPWTVKGLCFYDPCFDEKHAQLVYYQGYPHLPD